MKAVISSNNEKPMVFSFAEKNGSIKYMGYSDGWLHPECGGTLSANGKPGHFDCRKCGTAFKKQSMLATQMDTRMERAKNLLSSVRLEHRNDKIGLIRFVVHSQSRPKAYQVIRDNHGNWTCGCEDFQVHKKYDDWHCKHVLACEYWLENEKQSKEDVPIRPSLIVTGTSDEFQKANSLDEKQIINGNDGVWAYLINGKVAISYCGTLKLADMMGVQISDVEAKEASEMIVATAKAYNPATQVKQAGANSQPKLISGRKDNDAEAKAIGKSKRNAALKVIPEYIVYDFANKHASPPPFDYLDAYQACVKVYTLLGFGDFHVMSIVKELYPEKSEGLALHSFRKPAELGRKEWVAIYRECQRHAQELDANPKVERNYWAKTIDGQIVAVTETGDNGSPVSEKVKAKPTLLASILLRQNLPQKAKRTCPKCGAECKGMYCSVCVDRMLSKKGWTRTDDLPTTSANIRIPTAEKMSASPSSFGKDKSPKKVFVHKTERGRWALAKDDGNGWAGEILTEGGGDYYPVPLNDFKGIREASVYAKKHYPDAKVVTMTSI